MSLNSLSSILMIIIIIIVILLAVLALIYFRSKNGKPKQEKSMSIDDGTGTGAVKEKKAKTFAVESVMDFMEFDKVEDNMIVAKNGAKYIMVVECQGINYDLMSEIAVLNFCTISQHFSSESVSVKLSVNSSGKIKVVSFTVLPVCFSK